MGMRVKDGGRVQENGGGGVGGYSLFDSKTELAVLVITRLVGRRHPDLTERVRARHVGGAHRHDQELHRQQQQ